MVVFAFSDVVDVTAAVPVKVFAVFGLHFHACFNST